jgi:hypothetical protein
VSADAKFVTSEFKYFVARVSQPPPMFVLTKLDRKPAAFIRGYCDGELVYVQNDSYLAASKRRWKAKLK